MRYVIIWIGLLMLTLAGTPSRAQDALPQSITLADAGYGDLTLSGMYGAAAAFVAFPSDLHIDSPLEVRLVYSASPLLNAERSTLTVLAGDAPLISIRPEISGAPHEVRFEVPAERVSADGLLLTLQGYLRLTDDACEETNNPGQWLTIHDASVVRFDPRPLSEAPDFATLPRAMIVQNPLESVDTAPLVFVLPLNPTGPELTAAARVAARLGAQSAQVRPLEVLAVTDLTDSLRASANLVIIGTPERQPLLATLDGLRAALNADGSGYLAADGAAVPAGDGVLQLTPSPYNPARSLLIVSGGTSEAVVRAAGAFENYATFTNLRGDYELIRADGRAPEATVAPPWSSGITTLAALGVPDRTVRGTGITDVYYAFDRPAGRVLTQGARFTLDAASSPTLYNAESYVAAFINEVFIGSLRTGEGATANRLTFELPVELLNQTTSGSRPQTWVIRLTVSNQLRQDACAQVHPETAWTTISSASAFDVRFGYLTLPELQAFPYPYVGSDAQPAALVVPNSPTSDEISAALRLALVMGHRARGIDLPLEVALTGDVTQTSHGNYHLLILGTLDRQPLLTTMIDQLPPVFDTQLYQAVSEVDSGIVRQSASPWNRERVVTLVYSAGADGFDKAYRGLITGAPPVGVPATFAIYRELDAPPSLTYRSITAEPAATPTVAGEPLLPVMEPWFGVTVVLTLATVLIIVILWLAYRRGNSAS
jgi:hypothetical protein